MGLQHSRPQIGSGENRFRGRGPREGLRHAARHEVGRQDGEHNVLASDCASSRLELDARSGRISSGAAGEHTWQVFEGRGGEVRRQTGQGSTVLALSADFLPLACACESFKPHADRHAREEFLAESNHREPETRLGLLQEGGRWVCCQKERDALRPIQG